MGLQTESCFVFKGTLLFSILLLYESRKLDGYEFPVYSTEFCPRNQTEWDERLSAINCNASNGYMCLPNRELTQLLEFCYIYTFIWMQEYNCFYLNKQHSRVNNYNCRHFRYGCPTSAYMSSKSFEHQSCVTIGDGCFIDEPSCNSTTTSPLESTDINYIDDDTINVKYNTSTYFRDSTEHNNKGNEPIANNDWISPVAIILGLSVPFISILVVYFISMYFREGKIVSFNIIFNNELKYEK